MDTCNHCGSARDVAARPGYAAELCRRCYDVADRIPPCSACGEAADFRLVWVRTRTYYCNGCAPTRRLEPVDLDDHYLAAGLPTPDALLHARLRAHFEVEDVMHHWGVEHRVTPLLLPQRFGDGRALIHLTPLATRPNYFIVRVDSSWLQHDGRRAHLRSDAMADGLEHAEWRLADPEADHVVPRGGDGIYGAIDEAFGRWRDEDDREEDETDADYEWPRVDLGYGCAWGLMRLGDDEPWGVITPAWIDNEDRKEG